MNRKRVAPVVLGLAVVGTGLYFAVFRTRPSDSALSASGTVEATEAALGFQGPGRIETVGPHDVKARPGPGARPDRHPLLLATG